MSCDHVRILLYSIVSFRNLSIIDHQRNGVQSNSNRSSIPSPNKSRWITLQQMKNLRIQRRRMKRIQNRLLYSRTSYNRGVGPGICQSHIGHKTTSHKCRFRRTPARQLIRSERGGDVSSFLPDSLQMNLLVNLGNQRKSFTIQTLLT